MDRQQNLAAISDGATWDIAIIGGGATGLGTALEAASRGYRTVLLEASDFAKGTSSRSTKLIHGGVRYLRSGQLSMVRESLKERRRLLRNASHLVRPLEFAIPSFRRGSRWYYFAGLRTYDLLAGRDGLENSRVLSAAQMTEKVPTVATTGLRGGVLYTDCQFDDARLAITLAQSIVDHGGVVLNYARVNGLQCRSGNITAVTFRDEETARDIEIRARVVVNAAGVFVDEILNLDRSIAQASRPRIVASQGSHLVLSRDFLPSDCAVMIPKTDDGRVLFAIPWYGRTLFGTTDRQVDHVTTEPRALDREIDYLLDHAGRYFTMAPRRSDVLAVFSGLRPLVGQSQQKQSTSALSREHEIHTSPAGLITVIGGKWTTYRKMGQDVVDLAIKTAGLDPRSSETATLRLHGCPSEMDSSVSVDSDPLTIYGSTATAVRQQMAAQPSTASALHPRLPFVEAQVIRAVTHEMARTVEDVLARRLRALFLDARAAQECAPRVAELMRTELQQSAEWQQTQVTAFNSLAAGYHC